jgi:hypothetical protein
MPTFAALWAIGTLIVAAAIIVRNYRRDGRRLDITDAEHYRSLTARLATPSPVLARCDQESDIAAGLERRRAMPLPAPAEDDLVDDGVRIGPRASHTVRVRVVE